MIPLVHPFMNEVTFRCPFSGLPSSDMDMDMDNLLIAVGACVARKCLRNTRTKEGKVCVWEWKGYLGEFMRARSRGGGEGGVWSFEKGEGGIISS